MANPREPGGDRRQESQSAAFTALTSDGTPVRAASSVVSYRLEPMDLMAGEGDLDVQHAQSLVDPIVRGIVQDVLGGLRWDELDVQHLRSAEATVTTRAAALLAPHHIQLDAVQLHDVFLDSSESPRTLAPAPSEQQAWDEQLHLEVVRQQSLALEQEGIGLASAYRLFAPSITESLVLDLSRPAWTRRATSPAPGLHVLGGDSLAMAVDVPP